MDNVNSNDSDYGNKVEWVDENRVRVRKHGKIIYVGEANDGVLRLVEAAGLSVPENPYVLPVTELHYWAVRSATDERNSVVVGYFWEEEDAKRVASKGKGWYNAPDTYHPVTLKILGARRG